jgi:MFS transporter, putative metabolite transport protein
VHRGVEDEHTIGVGGPHPNRGFLRRITLATAWGEGLDGYDLGIISVLVALITKSLHISPGWIGLIGASSLLGIFVGAPIFGYLTDRFGRRLLFTLDLAVFLAAGILQAFAQAGWQLFLLRLILGLAIGAEYAIGAPMLAEFVPASGRGFRLSLLEVCWYVGFLIAVLVGYGLLALGVNWRVHPGQQLRPRPGHPDHAARPAGVPALANEPGTDRGSPADRAEVPGQRRVPRRGLRR